MSVFRLLIGAAALICSIAAFAEETVPQPPGPDVPAECAKVFGAWVGDWNYIGRLWLRVVRVGPSCTVQYSYVDTSAPQKTFHLGAIENGTLSIPCGSGTCVFELHGDDLWASYSDTQARTNNAVFIREKP